jgi:hypothetical protein
MAAIVLKDAVCWIGQYAFGGVSHSIAIDLRQDAPECTVFGATARDYKPGLKGIGLQVDGYWDSAIDLGVQSSLMGASRPVTWASVSTVGTFAYLFSAISTDYKIGGQVGAVFPFSAGAQGTGTPVRGMLMENSTRTATGNGTGQQLGAITSTQKLYYALHVTAASASDTLDVIIQSDDNSGFTTPTTRATLTQITDVGGSVFGSIDGAITDDYWRFQFTIAGASTSFTIAGSMGIL